MHKLSKLKAIKNPLLQSPKQADFRRIKQKSPLHKSTIKLSAYSESPFSVVGNFVLNLNHKGKYYHVLFGIVDIEATTILGLTTCSLLNLVKRVLQVHDNMYAIIIQQFLDCFGEIGKFPCIHHITVDPAVPPVVHPPRKLPITLRGKLDKTRSSKGW
eukprot:gene6617-12155_t